jgi:hypothetical protein
MEALAASGGTLLIVVGYVIVKRCRLSTCHADSGCCEIMSPALEIAKQQTDRLEKHDSKLEEILIMLRAGGQLPQDLLSKSEDEEKKAPTTSTV